MTKSQGRLLRRLITNGRSMRIGQLTCYEARSVEPLRRQGHVQIVRCPGCNWCKPQNLDKAYDNCHNNVVEVIR